MRTLRVLVVDDSAYNRRAIGEALAEIEGVEVVGKAANGNEALKSVAELSPDLITLDLEMPRMDGFTFLRLLMARTPTPVIVVSGYSDKENVFRALELGALDFIAKPARTVATDLTSIHQELAEKVEMVRQLTPASIDPARRGSLLSGGTLSSAFPILPDPSSRPPPRKMEPRWIVAVGASTGGPSALVELIGRFPLDASAAVIIAQHMPPRFTKTFAERLNRLGGIAVVEAPEGGTPLQAGHGYVCPGGRCIEIVRGDTGLRVEVVTPRNDERFIPSVDRLFESVAVACGDRAIGVVLTGMGDDGAKGAGALKGAGGRVFAEAPETAVIYGMPGAAVRTGHVDQSMGLRTLGDHLRTLVGG